ncbi:MAG: hypothetical protein ACI9CP_000962 [Cryomorphaceae bacterium]
MILLLSSGNSLLRFYILGHESKLLTVRQKRFILLLCIFAFTNCSLHAQNEKDSLIQAWEDIALEDTGRLNALSSYVWGLPDKLEEDFMHYTQLGYDYAKKKDLKKYTTTFLTGYGEYYRVKEDSLNMAKYYSESFAIRKKMGDEERMAQIHLWGYAI